MNRILWTAVGATLVVGFAAITAVPAQLEKRFNRVPPRSSRHPSARALDAHRKLIVADLHADTLLWDRDLLRRAARGHVDLPRLIEGGVAIQFFAVATSFPRRSRTGRDHAETDLLTGLALVQRWPPSTWRSLSARALFQAEKLKEAAERSRGGLTILRSARELDAFLERRTANPSLVAGLLALEGSHALEGDLSNIDAFYSAGFRMMSPTHFFDNDIAGSAHGVAGGGLTAKGRTWLRRLEEKRILVDLAHASPKAIDDVLAAATGPVVVSHTGVKGTCDNPRNLSDTHLRAIGSKGGVVGIGFWPTAICGQDAAAVARAIRHAVTVAGIDHVGLGSDFDGAVTAPFDSAGLPLLTEALLAAGFGEEDLGKIMGGNVVRLLRRSLPPTADLSAAERHDRQ